MTRVSRELTEVSSRVDDAGTNISRESASIEREVLAATTTVESVRDALQRGGSRIGELLITAERTADSLLALAQENDRAAEGLRNLSTSSQETARMVHTLTLSSERTAERAAAGDAALERAGAAVKRIAVTLSDIETSAEETRHLSLRVRDGARVGRGVLDESQQGVDRLGASMDTVEQAMHRLGTSVSQIQLAAEVIDDVAGQTALLSLNATIVAAQVGEEGRGFAVVAQAVKALSLRTRASAATIVAMIEELNGQAAAAAAAVRLGRRAVQEGASSSREVGVALEAILGDTAAATERLDSIAGITGAQTGALRDVGVSLEHLVAAMAGIRSAAVEQAATAAALQDSTTTLGEHANTVDRALLGLGTCSRGAIKAVGDIQGVVRLADDSQQQQATTLAQVLGSVEAIAAAGGGHEAPMIALAKAVAAVRVQTIEIQGEMARFKI